jgi:hypothetical protein
MIKVQSTNEVRRRMTSAFHESPIKTQNIKGKPTLFRDKECSSKAAAHLKSTSKRNSANGVGQ